MVNSLALTVLIFVSIDCPVSNRYAPEIKRLYDQYSPQGVKFRLVYPNHIDSTAGIDAHISAYAYPPIAERDPDHKLVKLAGATITPEAAVFDKNGKLVYLGRIDDRVVELGRERPAATRHDLSDALAAMRRLPEVRRQLEQFGYEAIDDTPERFAAEMIADIARYSAIARDTGLKGAQ